MKIRYRLYGSADDPRVGNFVMSPRGRGAYLILGVKARGKRGGLGQPTFRLFTLDVERVPRADVEVALGECAVYSITWDRRARKARRLGS